ncbi:hus1 [Symbiodinium pilosum]|uniref:Hus1 protein n=1 Tax=Symbiodinium pilosum TaxID=2952 RepID=A0A812XY20_SYMPI|nr:hus1 [Symbiodinium pilosum]
MDRLSISSVTTTRFELSIARYPRQQKHDWARELAGQGSLTIAASSKAFRAGWIFVTVTSNSLAAYSLRIRWGNEMLWLKDGVQERDRLVPGTLRWFSLDVSAQRDRLTSIRAEAVAGVVGVCIRRSKGRRLGGWRRWGQELMQRLTYSGGAPCGWTEDLGCAYSAVANASMGVAASLAAIDVPSDNETATLELAVLALSSSSLATNASEFVLEAVLGDVATLPEEQTVIIDSLGPSCCASSSTGQKLYRVYRHYTRFASGLLRLFLSPLGAGLLVGAKLSARRKGESRWFETQTAQQERVLQLYINLEDLARQHPPGFWLEAAVEVQHPTNFTLSLLSDSSNEDVPTRLSPNVPVFDNVSEVASIKYVFQTAQQVASLCLKPCYGQVRMDIASNARQKQEDSSAHGNCTRLQAPDGGVLTGSVAVHKLFSAPSSAYEVELATHPGNNYIALPEMTALNLTGRKLRCHEEERCVFETIVNFDRASIGTAASGYAANLQHTLIALKADPDLHPETTCGLLTALAENRTSNVTVLKDARGNLLNKLEGILSMYEEPNSTYVVNVLVTLEGESGHSLAAASYVPLQLPAGGFELLPESNMQSTASLPFAFTIFAFCSLAWLLNKSSICKGRQDVREAAPDRIEMQMAYDLHEEGTTSLLVQQNYVPPSI